MDLSEYIREWVVYDNQIKTHSEEIKSLRSRRNDLTESIFDYAEKNNIQNAVIEISDGKLKFQNEIINLYDQAGRLIKSFQIGIKTDLKEKIELNDLESGVYFIKSKKKNLINNKIIILDN